MGSPEIRPDNKVSFIGKLRVRARLEAQPNFSVQVQDVDIHEASHAVVARRRGKRLKSVSIVGTSKYDGITELAENGDAVIAGASIASKTGGTWGDEGAIVAFGRDISSAVSEASSYVENNSREIFAVAVRLRQKATIGEEEVDDAMESVNRIEQQRVITTVTTEDGEAHEFEATSNENGNVVISCSWFDRPDLRNEEDEQIAA